MRQDFERIDQHLLGRNLDRTLRIAAAVDEWGEHRRKLSRRVLKAALVTALTRIERGEMTPREAAARARAQSGIGRTHLRRETPLAIADELLLLFLTALSHEADGRFGPVREYTLRCIHRILRSPPAAGQSSLARRRSPGLSPRPEAGA